MDNTDGTIEVCVQTFNRKGNMVSESCSTEPIVNVWSDSVLNTTADYNVVDFGQPVDKPWYQDIWDWATGWLHMDDGSFPILQIAATIVVAILLLKAGNWIAKRFADWFLSDDLAPDANVETDYMEELGYAAPRGNDPYEDYAYDGERDPR